MDVREPLQGSWGGVGHLSTSHNGRRTVVKVRDKVSMGDW
jgi:hypothetical protein